MNYVYIVSYDLNKTGQNYAGLYEELKKSPTWWHYLDSTWLVFTTESAEALWTRISPYLDQNDRALIIKVQPGTSNRSGWLEQKAWDWINSHVG